MFKILQRWRDSRAEAAQTQALDETVFRSIESSIDRMMRRGEATPENIRQAVKEITDLYYGPLKTKRTPQEGGIE